MKPTIDPDVRCRCIPSWSSVPMMEPCPIHGMFNREPSPALQEYLYWRDHITGESGSITLFGGDVMRADDV